jgi:hypothetical protein
MRDEEINGLQNYQIISQILVYELSKLLTGIVGCSFDLSLTHVGPHMEDSMAMIRILSARRRTVPNLLFPPMEP